MEAVVEQPPGRARASTSPASVRKLVHSIPQDGVVQPSGHGRSPERSARPGSHPISVGNLKSGPKARGSDEYP